MTSVVPQTANQKLFHTAVGSARSSWFWSEALITKEK